jgi:hypothetical protein
MINYLEQTNKKRFQLIPQIDFGYKYIKFDSRFISTIYKEWINNLTTEASENGLKYIENKYNLNYPLKTDNKNNFDRKRIKNLIIDSIKGTHNSKTLFLLKKLENIDNLINDATKHGTECVKNKYKIQYSLINIGIKQFEKDYKIYYDRCFNFQEKFNLRKNGNPISFSTNGYSINEQEKKVTEKNDKKSTTKIKLQNNKKYSKKGLFEADECEATDEYLNNYHKVSIDPNNESLLYCYSVSFNFAKLKFTNIAKAILVNDLLVTRRETGNKLNITKRYFNEISHITRNNREHRKNIRKSEIYKFYEELKDTAYKKTVNIENYKNYIQIVRKYWPKIWSYYGQNKVQKLELDTYINRKKAIHKIVRRLVLGSTNIKNVLNLIFKKKNVSELQLVAHKSLIIIFEKIIIN